MIRRAWWWLRRKSDREGSTTAEVEELLRKSENTLHAAEAEAQEAEELTSALQEMRSRNQFRERMVLMIQGGIR